MLKTVTKLLFDKKFFYFYLLYIVQKEVREKNMNINAITGFSQFKSMQIKRQHQNYVNLNTTLPFDTVQFSAKSSSSDNAILNKIKEIQSNSTNVSGNYNMNVEDCRKLLKYFGFTEYKDTTRALSLKFVSPYCTFRFLTRSNNIDVNACAALYRAIKNADNTNGELLLANSEAQYKQKLPEFIEKTKVKQSDDNKYRNNLTVEVQDEAVENHNEVYDYTADSIISYERTQITDILQEIKEMSSEVYSKLDSIRRIGLDNDYETKINDYEKQILEIEKEVNLSDFDFDALKDKADKLYENVFEFYFVFNDVYENNLELIENSKIDEANNEKVKTEDKKTREKTEKTSDCNKNQEMFFKMFNDVSKDAYKYSAFSRKYNEMFLEALDEVNPDFSNSNFIYLLDVVEKIVNNLMKDNHTKLNYYEVADHYFESKGYTEKQASSEFRKLDYPLKGKQFDKMQEFILSYMPKLSSKELKLFNKMLKEESKFLTLATKDDLSSEDKMSLIGSFIQKFDEENHSMYADEFTVIYEPLTYFRTRLMAELEKVKNNITPEEINMKNINRISKDVVAKIGEKAYAKYGVDVYYYMAEAKYQMIPGVDIE